MTQENNKSIDKNQLGQHVTANLSILWNKLHQYHWYVKGPHFISLHVKFEELYDKVAEWLDEAAEVLLANGIDVISTTEEYLEYSTISESKENEKLSAEEMVRDLAQDFEATSELMGQTVEWAGEKSNVVIEDVFTSIKGQVDIEIWFLRSLLGEKVTPKN